jgi:hypothetical protein
LWENLKEKNNLEDLVIDGMIILKCILNIYNETMWNKFIGEGRNMAGSCELGNMLSCTIECGEFLE